MQQIHTIDELKSIISSLKKQAKSISFVPTMGNLHAGHLSLLKTAHERCDVVIASIFVNPLQFCPNEDFGEYPRTLETDLINLSVNHCDYVFLPEKSALIKENTTYVEVPKIGETLEANHREGHLRGVATIVTKLFNLVQPDIACFGKKDYQQWLMIKKMSSDLNMDIEIVGCETVREDDGLALSSRNQYLNDEQRKAAPLLQQTLKQCAAFIKQHNNAKQAIQNAIQTLDTEGFDVDYLELRNKDTLELTMHSENSVLLATARLGKTRLLDNIEL